MEAQPSDDEDAVSRPWTWLRRELWAVVWASFLAACVATMVFFAFFDPQLLGIDDRPPAWLADRMTGYAIGFFFFWGVCLLAGTLTVLLLDEALTQRLDQRRSPPAHRP